MRRTLFLLIFIVSPMMVFSAIYPGEFYTSGPSSAKKIALTFDDGPGPETEKFLDLLKRHQVKATFFMLGELAGYKPLVVKRVTDDGHEVASHTTYHTNYKSTYKKIFAEQSSKGRGDEEAVKEVKQMLLADMKKSDALIQKATGQKISLCRMPHGIDRPWIKETAREMGYTLVNWTYGADWSPQSYEQLLPGYLKAIKPGAIFLFHDGGRNRVKSLQLTEAVILEAKKQGYSIVPVGELLR